MNAAHRRILAKHGAGTSDLIGSGGEFAVYGLGSDRVLKVRLRPTGRAHSLVAVRDFLDEIAGRLPFATPIIEEIGPDEAYTIERRLPGRPMTEVLGEIRGPARQTAWRDYVVAVDALALITLPDRPYGHLLAVEPIHADNWTGFVRASLQRFAAINRATIATVGDPDQVLAKGLDLAKALDPLPPKSLVHGDYFPGNVLLDETPAVSAVLDFDVYTVVGDAMLDGAVACLTLEMIEAATAADVDFVRGLLVERHGVGFLPAMRCYRALVALSMADPANAAAPYPRLYDWSLDMLRRLMDDNLPA